MNLSQYISSIRVSSTLDDDDQFDCQHLIDNKLETCWNSDEGESQFAMFKFSQPLDISHFELTFQGGFGAEHLSVLVGIPITESTDQSDEGDHDDDDDQVVTTTTATKRKIGLKTVAEFASQDASSTQSFTFSTTQASALKIVFSHMADMFGRVILYNLTIYGSPSQQ